MHVVLDDATQISQTKKHINNKLDHRESLLNQMGYKNNRTKTKYARKLNELESIGKMSL